MWHVTGIEEKQKRRMGWFLSHDDEFNIEPWALTSLQSNQALWCFFKGQSILPPNKTFFFYPHYYTTDKPSPQNSSFRNVQLLPDCVWYCRSTCFRKKHEALAGELLGGPLDFSGEGSGLWEALFLSFSNSAFVIPMWLTGFWAEFGLLSAGDLVCPFSHRATKSDQTLQTF